MEVNKKPLNSVERLPNEELPRIDTQYSEPGKKPLKDEGRISNALSESITATPRSIEKKYGFTIKDEVVKRAVDENGKIVKPSALQKKLLLNLEWRISLLLDKPNVREYLDHLEKGDASEPNIKEFINLEEICRDVYGEEERWKSDKQSRIRKELNELSKKKQLHIYKATYKDSEGRDQEAQVKDFYPYINLTGRETHVTVGKRTAIAVEVEFSRIFFERLWDRYHLLPSSFWEAVGSNNQRIKGEKPTDIFISLSTIAVNKSWSHYHHDLPEAKKYIKSEKILDPEKITDIKEKALTHTPISFEELEEALEKKYDKSSKGYRTEWRRFKSYLWEAMWALISKGILTEKSDIDFDKENFTLVYSENPTEPRTGKPGGKWAENPYPIKKK